MNLVNFDFNGNGVRTITDDKGNPWFVAIDVCAALTINSSFLPVYADDG